MFKPDSLRAFLTSANPELKRDPDRLNVFIDEGSLQATYAPGISFEYAYTLSLVFTDYAGDPDAIIVPMLVWIRDNQPELLANPENRGRISFQADILSNDAVDLEIKIPLTERVGVQPRSSGGYDVTHFPEPQLEPTYQATHWTLYAGGEVIAEWDVPVP